MEVIIEFVLQLLVGGFADASGNPIIPKWLRLIFAAVAFVPFICLMIFLAIKLYDKNILSSIFFGLVALALLGAMLFLWRKALKS